MKLYWKYLILGFFFGVFFSIYGTCNMYNLGITPKLSALVVDMGFGDLGGCCLEATLKYMIKLFPYFIFIMIFTTYIYRHFCEGSVYVFSRCKNRIKWVCMEMTKLFLFSGAYVMLLVLGRLTPGLICGEIKIDAIGCRLLIYFNVIMIFWLFQVTLLGNILAIVMNSQVGTIVACTSQTISIIALALIDDTNLTGVEVIKLKLNLNSRLVVEWHEIQGVACEYLNKLGVALNYKESVLYVIFVAMLWVGIGITVIQKMDIIQGNKEI